MNISLTKEGNILGTSLLIASCCIGAGMIGLPVISLAFGFIPSLLAMLICYFFSTATGLLILEATLWFNEEINFISIINSVLGKIGKVLIWILFPFLFYCLFIAYIDGLSQICLSTFSEFFSYKITQKLVIVFSVTVVGLIAYKGTNFVNYCNRIFLFGMICSFCFLIFLCVPNIKLDRLLFYNLKNSHTIMPVLLVCFGYQNLIPTLTYYTKKNIAVIRKAIFIGNVIPLIIYCIWNFVILGNCPYENSFMFFHSTNEVNLVPELLKKTSVFYLGVFFIQIFSFFAIITSFIANIVAFLDFIKDGLISFRKSRYNLMVFGIVLIPPTLFAMLFPNIFLKALSIAGGSINIFLFGILPVLVVSVGRYIKKFKGPFIAPGGKFFLTIVLCLSLSFLLIRS